MGKVADLAIMLNHGGSVYDHPVTDGRFGADDCAGQYDRSLAWFCRKVILFIGNKVSDGFA